MIIQLRGTSGAGKTFLATSLMGLYESRHPIRTSLLPNGKKRKHPIGYKFLRHGCNALFVPGHYESACGGADTISFARTSADQGSITGWEYVNGLVKDYHENGHNVLYEGMMVGSDFRFALQFHTLLEGNIRVVNLNTPIEQCFENVIKRRLARGDKSKFYKHNTRQRVKTIDSAVRRLGLKGVPVFSLSVEEAWYKCLEWLQLPFTDFSEVTKQ